MAKHRGLLTILKINSRKGGNCSALHSRPLDIAPVVLGFNHEAHNTPVYKFNNHAISADQYCTPHTSNLNEVELSEAELQRLNRLNLGSVHNLGPEVDFHNSEASGNPQRQRIKYQSTQSGNAQLCFQGDGGETVLRDQPIRQGYSPIIGVPTECLRFPIYCFLSKPKRVIY